jgi:putative Mn2+ efflux pump MntP
MTFWEIVLIGIALSMDAAAVSMTNGMIYQKISKYLILIMAFAFGLFQALMPLAGYFTGGLFSTIITRYSGFLVFLILGFIGIKMLVDGLKKSKEIMSHKEITNKPNFTYKLLFWQAIATSIDAFAVGIGFSAIKVSIIPAITIIGITTFVLSVIAFIIGKKCGDLLGNMASVLGGLILIALAIKALL